MTTRFPCFALLAACLLAAAIPSTVHGQLPAARFGSVVPLSGGPGQTFDATIAGDDLDGASQLTFSHAGITAKQKMLDPGPFDTEPRPAPNEFVVTIAGNVPPGRYEVRATGKYGVSNSRTFFVSSLPQALEAEPNASTEEATELELPADVSGLLAAAADVDYFRFQSPTAARIILDCYARRADSAADAVVTIYDAQQREIASSRDAQAHDPLIDVQVAAGQPYTIRLHDAAYRGGAGYHYRFTVGALPHIDYLFPPAAEAGGNRPFTVYGRNLKGGQNAGLEVGGRPLEMLAVKISLPANASPAGTMFVEPASSHIAAVPFQVANDVGPSNTVMAGVASSAPVLEVEPNSQPSQAQALTIPCEVMGQFLAPRDRDWFTFSAKAGDSLVVEVISDRLGLGTDPTLLIERVDPPAEGESEPKITQVAYVTRSEIPDSGPEFFTGTGDPVHLFTVESDGEYRMLLRDRHNALRADPRHVYRLAIRKTQPDFRLAAVPLGSSSSLLLRRGGRVGLRVIAFRRDGFDGEIRVTAAGLPPGVTCEPAIIGPSRSAATLTLTAAGNAADATAAISVTGTAEIAGAAAERRAIAATATEPPRPVQNNRPPPPSAARMAEGILLCVSAAETQPVLISAGGNKVWETSRAGIVKVPYSRSGPFQGRLTLVASDLPADISAQTLTINPNQNSGEHEIRLRSTTPVGTYTFVFMGTAEQVDYVRNPEAAAAAALRKQKVDEIAAQTAAASKVAADAKAAADKALADAATAATAAAAARQQAEQLLAGATAARDAAKAKLAEANRLAAAQADDAALKSAAAAAQKALADEEIKVKAATDALAAAEKANSEAQSGVAKATEEQTKSGEAATLAAERARMAAELKTITDKQAQDAAEAAKPRKLNVPVVSSPITLKITPTPAVLQPIAAKLMVKQGEKVEIPVALERKYGFTSAVNLSVSPPPGVAGLSTPNAQVPDNQTQGKLELSAAQNATPGEHRFKLNASMNLNGQNLTAEEWFTVVVEEVKPVEPK